MLPGDPAQRKRLKPDLEALIHIPAQADEEHGLLVAWGSASRPQREFAVVFTLDAQGGIAAGPVKMPLEALCRPLRQRYGELNLEAGFAAGGRLHLFQRANRGQPVNGHITFAVRAMRDWLCGLAAEPPQPLEMTTMSLGAIDGVPLGITDAAALPEGGWIFSAVAEDTSDAYGDGQCVGSVIGWTDARGVLQGCERLLGAPKAEGVAIAPGQRLWLVTDADDPARPSELLELHLPG